MTNTPAITIPYEKLDADTLQGIIEAFVLQEGTEYGVDDVPLEEKVLSVKKQLQNGQAQIFFDPELESCWISPR